MPKYHGFKPQGCINPIAAARSTAPINTGPTIRDYLNRPRPSWDEVKQRIKEKEGANAKLEQFEAQQEQNYHTQLKRYRESVLESQKEFAKKKDKHHKHKKASSPTEKKHHKKVQQHKKRKIDSINDHEVKKSDEENENDSSSSRSSDSESNKEKVLSSSQEKKLHEAPLALSEYFEQFDEEQSQTEKSSLNDYNNTNDSKKA